MHRLVSRLSHDALSTQVRVLDRRVSAPTPCLGHPPCDLLLRLGFVTLSPPPCSLHCERPEVLLHATSLPRPTTRPTDRISYRATHQRHS